MPISNFFQQSLINLCENENEIKFNRKNIKFRMIHWVCESGRDWLLCKSAFIIFKRQKSSKKKFLQIKWFFSSIILRHIKFEPSQRRSCQNFHLFCTLRPTLQMKWLISNNLYWNILLAMVNYFISPSVLQSTGSERTRLLALWKIQFSSEENWTACVVGIIGSAFNAAVFETFVWCFPSLGKS